MPQLKKIPCAAVKIKDAVGCAWDALQSNKCCCCLVAKLCLTLLRPHGL